MTQQQPWYREPWAWFVLSPLIVVVIVSSITVTIAVKTRDDRVIDNYYKEGRMINMRLDEDLRAIAISATAQVRFDADINEVVIALTQNEQQWPQALMLELSHPARQELDQVIRLEPLAAGFYRGELLTNNLTHRWYLRLLPVYSDTSIPLWRLRGEIDFSQTTDITLKPDA